MVLDSSGSCDGERRMAVANAARSARFELRDRSLIEVADDGLGHRLRRLLPYSLATTQELIAQLQR
jgi:hypothetical protein